MYLILFYHYLLLSRLRSILVVSEDFCHIKRPFFTLFLALLGQGALKFAFANVIEVKLIESDQKLKMHPVAILLSVALWGHVWGPTGMLLSVPLMAFLKISLLSDVVPASYRDPVLTLLEGSS